MVMLMFVRVRLETRTELEIRLGKQRTWGWRAGKFRWKSILSTDDHFDCPALIHSPSSRSVWLSQHVSGNTEM